MHQRAFQLRWVVIGILFLMARPSVASSASPIVSERVNELEKEVDELKNTLSDLDSRYLDVPAICNGRLTLTSGTAVTTSDVTAAGTIYFTPYKGSKVSLFDGTRWKLYSFTELSLALSVASGSNYDVFLYDNAGTLTMELTVWTNDTTRATALVLQDGVYVKTGVTTRRYLGTIRGTGVNTTEDSLSKRYVWNAYNRAEKTLYVYDATASWSYATTTFRSANNNTANRVSVVAGLADSRINVRVKVMINPASVGYAGICEDCTNNATASSDGMYGLSAVNAKTMYIEGNLSKIPAVGFHYYQWTEYSSGISVFQAGAEAGVLGSFEC